MFCLSGRVGGGRFYRRSMTCGYGNLAHSGDKQIVFYRRQRFARLRL
ncbi:MAG: hypothetical protein LBU62_00365 [Bacteroidales bacterium]|nr:hypothetical protein [Bacteroidales bacterium]